MVNVEEQKSSPDQQEESKEITTDVEVAIEASSEQVAIKDADDVGKNDEVP